MTEADIIKGCIQKNTNCQRLLFDAYAGKLMTLCLRYCNNKADAEDVLQEAFLKIFYNIHQYKFQGSFEGWIKRITVNCALKKIRKEKINFEEIITDEIPNAAKNLLPEDILNEKELLALVNSLPNGYRIIFNLYVLEEYTHEEIAKMLGIQTVTSRSQLLKAKRMLQQKILVMKKIRV